MNHGNCAVTLWLPVYGTGRLTVVYPGAAPHSPMTVVDFWRRFIIHWSLKKRRLKTCHRHLYDVTGDISMYGSRVLVTRHVTAYWSRARVVVTWADIGQLLETWSRDKICISVTPLDHVIANFSRDCSLSPWVIFQVSSRVIGCINSWFGERTWARQMTVICLRMRAKWLS